MRQVKDRLRTGKRYMFQAGLRPVGDRLQVGERLQVVEWFETGWNRLETEWSHVGERVETDTGLRPVEGMLETFYRLVRVRLQTLLRWPLFVDCGMQQF